MHISPWGTEQGLWDRVGEALNSPILITILPKNTLYQCNESPILGACQGPRIDLLLILETFCFWVCILQLIVIALDSCSFPTSIDRY